MNAGKLAQLLVHGGDQLLLILVEDGPPFLFGLEVDKVFGVEEAGGVGAVVGASGLADDLRNLGEAGHHDACLVGEVDRGGRAFAGRQRTANPDRSLIKVGQKLRADGPAEGEIDGDGKKRGGDAQGGAAMLNGRANRRAIVRGEPDHDRVVPLFGALAEDHAGHHRSNKHGEAERSDQGKADGPGHGLEEPALDCLQGEDGQVGGDDDAAGEEDGALHLVRGLANALRRGMRAFMLRHMADDVFNHHHRAVNQHSKVKRAQREQVGWNVAEVEADGGKHQREGNGEGDNNRAAYIAEEEKENDGDQNHARSQVVFDRIDGEAHQIGAVEEGHDLDALGQNAGVVLVSVELRRLRRECRQAQDRSRRPSAAARCLRRCRDCRRSRRRRDEWRLPIWPRRIFGPCATVAMSLILMAAPFWVLTTVFSMSCTLV